MFIMLPCSQRAFYVFIILPCSQRALVLVLEYMGNFGVRLPPGCSRHGIRVHCLSFVRVPELAGDARQWWQLGLCLCSLTEQTGAARSAV